MKFKNIVASLLSAFLFLLFVSNSAFAQTTLSNSDYVIENFESNIKINQDTSVTIEETIVPNYFINKHGIYRVIPTLYTNNGKTLNTKLKIVSITDEKGIPYKYTTSKNSQSIEIKIGDPNLIITGKHTYIITYKINNFIFKYDSVPEFYWNVTGHEWDVPILKASANVESTYATITKIICFTGIYKSTETKCTNSFTDNLAQFSSNEKINPGSDFTVVVGLDPVNQLKFPSPIIQFSNKLIDNWGYFAALLPVLLVFLVWLKNGRDEKFVGDNIYYKPEDLKTEKASIFKRKFLPTVYSPINGLTPSEVGTIFDERVDTHDLIAEIIELGRLGIIRIEKIKKEGIFKKDDYSFTKLTNTLSKEEKLKDFQKEILKELFRKTSVYKTVSIIDKIFKKDSLKKKEIQELASKNRYVLLSALKLNFYQALDVIKDKLYKSLVKDQIFARNPEKSKSSGIASYLLLSFIYISTVLSIFTGSTLNVGPVFLAILITPIGIIFAANMPKRKAWGYSLFRQCEGLKHYIEVGKWRQEIAEKELFIEEMLPLAIALRVVDKLAKDMKELGVKPPEYMTNFTVSSFSKDFVNFQSFAATSIVAGTQSRSVTWSGHSSWSGGSGFSSGGGFSGGGGGGGGGGSW